MTPGEGWGDPTLWDAVDEVETEFFRFKNIGDVLIGKLINKTEKPVRGELSGHYTLEREDGSHVAFHGSTYLDDLMAAVETGLVVRVEYTGDEPTNNGTMKLFSVKSMAIR